MLLCALLANCAPQAGCEPQPVTATDPASPAQAALVDSIPIGETDPLVVRRVVLRSSTQADTLPGVLASSLPVVTGKGEAVGLGYTADGSVYAYRYSPDTRVVRQATLPDDFDGYLSEGSFSADGRYLAYVAFPREGQGEAVVRSWPDGRLVCRGPRVELPATHNLLNGTGWTRASFLIYLDLGSAPYDEVRAVWPPHRGWLRVRGSLSARKLQVDTVTEPELRRGRADPGAAGDVSRIGVPRTRTPLLRAQ
jgi:hypothetical protein